MYLKVDHIGIAVRSLRDALRVYESALGFGVERIEAVPTQKTRTAMLPVGETRIELLEAMDEDSPIARFLAKRGEGIHHICFQVRDIVAEIRKLQSEGVRLIDETPRPGAGGNLIAFIHPSSTGGVLIELSQPTGEITNSHSE